MRTRRRPRRFQSPCRPCWPRHTATHPRHIRALVFLGDDFESEISFAFHGDVEGAWGDGRNGFWTGGQILENEKMVDPYPLGWFQIELLAGLDDLYLAECGWEVRRTARKYRTVACQFGRRRRFRGHMAQLRGFHEQVGWPNRGRDRRRPRRGR